MLPKNLMVSFVIAVAALTTIGMVLPTINSVSAVTRFCNFAPPPFCVGTNGNDAMSGDGQGNAIVGCGGNDVISGAGGPDGLAGDGIEPQFGCPIGGNFGADRISGGTGDDIITHGPNVDTTLTDPDGHRDFIDCGPGKDTVFINANIDNDVATNCEILNVG